MLDRRTLPLEAAPRGLRFRLWLSVELLAGSLLVIELVDALHPALDLALPGVGPPGRPRYL
jgi:hypothetical protein